MYPCNEYVEKQSSSNSNKKYNDKQINKIYEEYERVFFKYSPLRKSLERRGFVVKKNKDLDYIIENKLWMEENKVEYTESMEKFLELFEKVFIKHS